MSEQHEQAGQVHEAEEVVDAVSPSSDESAIVPHPCKYSLDFPSAPVTAQRPAILGHPLAVGLVGPDHLNAIILGQRLPLRIRAAGFVADQSFGQRVEEASGQNSFHIHHQRHNGESIQVLFATVLG